MLFVIFIFWRKKKSNEVERREKIKITRNGELEGLDMKDMTPKLRI